MQRGISLISRACEALNSWFLESHLAGIQEVTVHGCTSSPFHQLCSPSREGGGKDVGSVQHMRFAACVQTMLISVDMLNRELHCMRTVAHFAICHICSSGSTWKQVGWTIIRTKSFMHPSELRTEGHSLSSSLLLVFSSHSFFSNWFNNLTILKRSCACMLFWSLLLLTA